MKGTNGGLNIDIIGVVNELIGGFFGAMVTAVVLFFQLFFGGIFGLGFTLDHDIHE